ncbi:MAG: HAD-IA family hydrolase [Dehalococcoidia bacterium]|nr:HAD-IA family hydrolase [Dehalococcoidia bacterium]
MTPFDVVVFDLGGVLVEIAASWAEAHARSGYAAHPITADPAFEAARADLGALHQVGRLSNRAFYEGLADASRGAYDTAEIERIFAAWSGPEHRDVGRVVDAIEARGVATGSLSNTNPAHWPRLDGTSEYPTVARLGHRHASHLLGVAKPDAAIFEAFTVATGFAPERIVFFDDVEAYVEGARRAGWTAVHIDAGRPTAPQLLEALRHLEVIA